MKINPCWWSHDWGQWNTTLIGDIQSGVDEEKKPRITGKFIMQEKSCNKCGFKEIQRQKLNIV